MTALELLMTEHRVIERVLDALEARVPMPARFYLDAAEFIRGATLDRHQAVEIENQSAQNQEMQKGFLKPFRHQALLQ